MRLWRRSAPAVLPGDNKWLAQLWFDCGTGRRCDGNVNKMTTTIREIFREIQAGQSLSIARKYVFEGAVHFNGQQVTSMMQEVELEDGVTFQIDKRNIWCYQGGKWVDSEIAS